MRRSTRIPSWPQTARPLLTRILHLRFDRGNSMMPFRSTCTRGTLFAIVISAFGITTFSGAASAWEADDFLAVSRTDSVYESVFTNRKINRFVGSWYIEFWGNRKNADNERLNYLREVAAAGMTGPFAMKFVEQYGEAAVDSMHAISGITFPFSPHFYPEYGSLSTEAKKAGAVFYYPMSYDSFEKGKVAAWDPKLVEIATAETERWLQKYGKKPWLAYVFGYDEPFNYNRTVRMPGAVERVNSELKKKYGVTIPLSAQDTTIAVPWEISDPALLNKSPHELAMLRIAVWRWLNEQLYIASKPEYDLVKKNAPSVEYHTYNHNAINMAGFMEKNVSDCMDRIDQSVLYPISDSFSADPYPTFNLERDGKARSLYHVGFISKFITDLAAGKSSKIIMQGFRFSGLLPTLRNIREWTSQAAKAGVTHLDWFGSQRYDNPEFYREVLRLSHVWKEMPALDIPKTAGINVIFSDDSRNAVNDDMMHSFYMLHVLLGERVGAWFRFTGENHVRKGLQSLDEAKLIIAPQLGYVSKTFAETLLGQVKQGATLVMLDPDALVWDIETGSLAAHRLAIMGCPAGKPRDVSHILPAPAGAARFKGIDRLIIQHSKTGAVARTLDVPGDARILFTYEDGAPAVYSRRIGKGEIICFCVMPFGNSELAVNPKGWDAFFAALCDESAIQRNLPIWDFLIPAKGGEVATYTAGN